MRRWVVIRTGTSKPSSMTFTTLFQVSQAMAGLRAKMLEHVIAAKNMIHRLVVVFSGNFFLSEVNSRVARVASANMKLIGMLLRTPQMSFWGVINVSHVHPRTPED